MIWNGKPSVTFICPWHTQTTRPLQTHNHPPTPAATYTQTLELRDPFTLPAPLQILTDHWTPAVTHTPSHHTLKTETCLCKVSSILCHYSAAKHPQCNICVHLKYNTWFDTYHFAHYIVVCQSFCTLCIVVLCGVRFAMFFYNSVFLIIVCCLLSLFLLCQELPHQILLCVCIMTIKNPEFWIMPSLVFIGWNPPLSYFAAERCRQPWQRICLYTFITTYIYS